MDDLKKIVWLASYPKSGNTWFRAFLTALLSPEGNMPDINNMYPTTIASNRHFFDEIAGLYSADLTMREIEQLRPRIYRQNAIESKEILYHKVHDAYTFLPQGEPIIPKDVTKVVLYFIRNPLDVVISFAHHLTLSIDRTIQIMNNPKYAFCNREDRLHNQLRQKLLTWSGHVKSWVDESELPLLVLRYEDMLNNPTETFNRAIKFAGLDHNIYEIQRAIYCSSFSKLQDQEKEKGFKEKTAKSTSFFRKGISGEWRDVLSDKQVKIIVNAHKEVMGRFGYLDDLKK